MVEHLNYFIIYLLHIKQVNDHDIVYENGPWSADDYETDTTLDLSMNAVVITSELKLRIFFGIFSA